jgi:hypothetical protein
MPRDGRKLSEADLAVAQPVGVVARAVVVVGRVPRTVRASKVSKVLPRGFARSPMGSDP